MAEIDDETACRANIGGVLRQIRLGHEKLDAEARDLHRRREVLWAMEMCCNSKMDESYDRSLTELQGGG